MALAVYDEYLAALKANQVAVFQTTAGIGRVQRLSAAWRYFVPAPAIPTTSAATNKSSAESIGPIPAVSSGRLTLLGGRMHAFGASNSVGGAGFAVTFIDLLNHSGGLSGTLTTAQTTNLPTAALTRHTSGAGVMAGLIIYTIIGSVATTVTISYTNQAGTPGRISTATQIGANGFREAGSLIPIPLAAGDTGVRSVQSVTLAGTTGTAGNFGVVLFKPLQMMALNDMMGSMPLDAVSSGGIIGSLCEVHPDACLTVATINGAAQLATVHGAIILAEV